LLGEEPLLQAFSFFVVLVALGGLVSFIQKLLTIKFKNNVELSIGPIFLQMFMVFTGVLFFLTINGSTNEFVSDLCGDLEGLSEGEKVTVD